MIVFQKISSLVLLSIYSLIIAHNVVPHSHDFTDLDSTINELIHHNHAHHDHAHHDQEEQDSHQGEESDWLSFLIDIFEGLEHSNLEGGQFEDYLVQNSQGSISYSIDEYLNFDYLEIFLLPDLKYASNEVSNFYKPPPLLYEILQSSSDLLRGPPSLS